MTISPVSGPSFARVQYGHSAMAVGPQPVSAGRRLRSLAVFGNEEDRQMTRSRSSQGRSRRGRDRSGGQGRPPADTQVQEAPPVESQQPESQPRRRGGPPGSDQRQAEDSPQDNRARQADP